MKWQTRKLTSNQVGLKYGFRSGLEIAISQELDANSVKYDYEKVKLTYVKPQKAHTYTPDFYLEAHDFYIETKGLLGGTVIKCRVNECGDSMFPLEYEEYRKKSNPRCPNTKCDNHKNPPPAKLGFSLAYILKPLFAKS